MQKNTIKQPALSLRRYLKKDRHKDLYIKKKQQKMEIKLRFFVALTFGKSEKK